jgi:hypothetical protein
LWVAEDINGLIMPGVQGVAFLELARGGVWCAGEEKDTSPSAVVLEEVVVVLRRDVCPAMLPLLKLSSPCVSLTLGRAQEKQERRRNLVLPGAMMGVFSVLQERQLATRRFCMLLA